MTLLKRLLGILLPLLVIATVMNDTGRYLRAMYDLSSVTQTAADASAGVARTDPDRNASWKAGDEVARQNGAEIYGYDLTETQVHVWARTEVRGTWVLRRIHQLLAKEKEPAPLIVDDEAFSVIR